MGGARAPLGRAAGTRPPLGAGIALLLGNRLTTEHDVHAQLGYGALSHDLIKRL
jgi:hypothetical protein